MGKGKFKGKPTGQRTFSTDEEIAAGGSARRPDTFRKKQAEKEPRDIRVEPGVDEDEVDNDKIKRKGAEGLIEVDNPNITKPNNVKAKNIDVDSASGVSDLSRREREELEKQKSQVRYMNLRMEGKTEQARNDLERLAMIRQQRADAAKRREEEKAALEARKAEARK